MHKFSTTAVWVTCLHLHHASMLQAVCSRRVFVHLLRSSACPRLARIYPRTLANKPFIVHFSQRKLVNVSWVAWSLCLGWATSLTPQSSASDPAEAEALQCLEQGTAKLEEGDVLSAKELYQRSTEIKRTASSLFNLGVTHYHLSKYFHYKQGQGVSEFL